MTRATIYVNNNAGMRVETTRPYLSKAFLKEHLPYRAQITYNPVVRNWKIGFNHINELIELLRRHYDEVVVRTRHRTVQICNTSCQNAKGDDCVCSCHGLYHKTQAKGSFYRALPNEVLIVGVDEEEAVRVLPGYQRGP